MNEPKAWFLIWLSCCVTAVAIALCVTTYYSIKLYHDAPTNVDVPVQVDVEVRQK